MNPDGHDGLTGSMRADELHDVVIIGGGPAGLSAALVLGRARRRVLVIDAGRPANAVSRAVGGLLAWTGSPAALRRAGRRQLRALPNVEVVDGDVLNVEPSADEVTVAVARPDGVTQVRSRALLFAHGLSYEPPYIPGIRELWGRSVFHCPFCDGLEVADRPVALHAREEGAARLALLLTGWTNDVLLCTDGPDGISADERERLEAAGVRVREEPIARLESRRGRLTQIVFEQGAPESREAMFIRPHRAQPTLLAEAAGLEVGDDGLIVSDDGGRTAVERVYVAGDAAAQVRSVAIAIGNGARVGTAMAADLIVDRLAPPVLAEA
jgi:thioredoxin reductase